MRIQIAGVHKYQILTSVAIKINSKWPTNCAGTFPPMLDGEDSVPFASRPPFVPSQAISSPIGSLSISSLADADAFCLFAFPATQRKFTSQSELGREAAAAGGGPGGGSLTQAPMCAHSARQSYLFDGLHVLRSMTLAPNVGNI